jgi:hypothetical protein
MSLDAVLSELATASAPLAVAEAGQRSTPLTIRDPTSNARLDSRNRSGIGLHFLAFRAACHGVFPQFRQPYPCPQPLAPLPLPLPRSWVRLSRYGFVEWEIAAICAKWHPKLQNELITVLYLHE